MRLLHARNLTFDEFFDTDDERLPKYAILSHRWAKHEVSYKQFIEGTHLDGPAFDKIKNACAQTLEYGLEWLWVDTICIDKSSSAELSEAINSMWTWYSNSTICLTYLADVSCDSLDQIVGSEWFSRGWTLQELIAPYNLWFYDSRWQLDGSKHVLEAQVCEASGIDADFLMRRKPLNEASVAMKLSWASTRKTTRKEDEAYCLLGLLEVNMPLLYGEGDNAFFRLQLEILRTSDDESIFAWRSEPVWKTSYDSTLRGMLAKSPSEFAGSGNIFKMTLGPEQRLPWAWTNKGLELRIVDRADKNSVDPMPAGNPDQVIFLGCYIKGRSINRDDVSSPSLQRLQADATIPAADSYIAITLKRLDNAWYRPRSEGFFLETGFVSTARSSKTPLVYKYYYVPRWPTLEAYSQYPDTKKLDPA